MFMPQYISTKIFVCYIKITIKAIIVKYYSLKYKNSLLHNVDKISFVHFTIRSKNDPYCVMKNNF